MPDVITSFQILKDTPVPNILLVAGLVFLFLGFVGKFAFGIDITNSLWQRIMLGILGVLLLLSGIALYIAPPITATSTPTPTVTPIPPTNTPEKKSTDTPVPSRTPTNTSTPEPTNTPVKASEWDAIILASTPLRLRPDESSHPMLTIDAGKGVDLIGLSKDNAWVKVTYYENGLARGWIQAENVKFNIPIDDLSTLPE